MSPDASAPGPLIGSGRAADIYDLGDGRVLRRNRTGDDTALEAATMEHLLAHGYPVPRVYESDGPDLVMERIDGVTMLEVLGRAPWRLRGNASLLAELQHRLSLIPLPSLPLRGGFGEAQVIVHADFHPDNVMLSPAGPVVIDWPNAKVGPRGADAALSWVIMATSEIDGGRVDVAIKRAGRSMFVRSFLARCNRDQARGLLGVAAEHRLRDRNIRPAEAAGILALLKSEGAARLDEDGTPSVDLGPED